MTLETDLKFVCYSNGQLTMSKNQPPDINLDLEVAVWRLGDGEFRIGRDIRTLSGTNELPEGIVFVFNFNDDRHYAKWLSLHQDIMCRGRLVVA